MTDPAIHDAASRQASGPSDAIRDAHDNLKAGIEIMGCVHDIPPQIHKAMHALSYAVKVADPPPSNWRDVVRGCQHDMGFDRELGPVGCDLDAEGRGGCVCAGIHAALKTLEAAASNVTQRGKPVAWRWRPRGAVNWIYDPTAEWRSQQKGADIDIEPLYSDPCAVISQHALVAPRAANAKAESLREVRNDLRKLAIVQHERQASGGLFIKNGRSCRICKGAWTNNGPEFHALTCTAVPLEEAIAAPPAVDRAMIEAGKQARFKHGKGGWFGVTPDHNNPDSFEYRTIYALADAKGDGKP